MYGAGSGLPAVTLGPPPCIFRARTVATRTTALGASPLVRHLMSTNFSNPRSAPNPDSVTTYSASFRPRRSAMMEEFPCAMFPKGPAWTKTGCPSRVCIRVGFTVSFIRTAAAPATPRSSVVTGAPEVEYPTTIRPIRRRRSSRSLARGQDRHQL